MRHLIDPFFIAFFLLLCNNAGAQEPRAVWQWAAQLGGPGWDMANGTATDGKGNVYVAGAFTDSLTANGKVHAGAGGRDVYVACFDGGGKLSWTWTGGGKGMDKVTALEEAPEGGVYVAGIFEGEGSLGKNKIGGGTQKLFLAHIDGKGKGRWLTALPFRGTASGFLLDAHANGDIAMAGSFTDALYLNGDSLLTAGHSDIFIVRFGPLGQVLDRCRIGGPGRDLPTALLAGDGGGTYLAAQYDRDIKAGDSLVAADALHKGNACILRLGEGYRLAGRKLFASDGALSVSGLAKGDGGHLFATGSFSQTLAYDTLRVQSRGLADIFVSKLSGTDSVAWLKTFGSKYQDHLNGTARNLLGGVMVTGSFSDTLDMQPFQLKAQGHGLNTFFAQLTDSGEVTWADSFGGSGHNMGSSTAIDPEGNIYLAGSFRGQLSHAQGSFTSKGDDDVFVAKFHYCAPGRKVLAAPQFLCPNTTAELSVGTGFYDIRWDGRPGKRKLAIDAPGLYRVSMVDGKGCSLKDSATVLPADPLTFTLGRDTSVAIGRTWELKGPDGADGYTWQDGQGGQTYLIQSSDALPGVYGYSLEVIDSLGCATSDTISIEFYLPPGFADLSAGSKLITVYPNPVVDKLNWQLQTQKEVQLVVEVTDAGGSVVVRQAVARYKPGETRGVDFSRFRPGHYFFSLSSGSQKLTVSIVKK